MDTIYLVLVIVLALLAVSDLIIGVSNDAVNFLNSAIGSKAFNFKLIMIIASVGILFGATFSSGMMEVARKGIFHPQFFYFQEIMILFIAVMITDVILLDLFNTFGMPTSTTVSIVFELLGAAVGLAILKVIHEPQGMEVGDYINSSKAMVIILGILLSVIIALTTGAIIQYLSRLLLSFNYHSKLKYFGAVWGGLASTAITYFILVKGAKGASFMSEDTLQFIDDNSFLIIVFSFIAWMAILQLILWLTKFDILKIIVLIGTFALAMAFAGNDLVNFIGVPLAGYNAYEIWVETGMPANEFLMSGLAGKVPTPTILLFISGVIMAFTLYFSKKAKTVTETEIRLGRQEEGYERFGSSALSRSVVRSFSKSGKYVNNLLPEGLKRIITKQFDRTEFKKKQAILGKNAPAFDLLRAAVILSVSAIIISIATNFKLPLSTTYVTFMVAMGASLADGAWGRESAVYRITGVLSVIGGWFLTAFFAFSAAFVLVFLFYFGSYYAIFGMVIIAAFIVFRTHVLHKKRKETFEKDLDEYAIESKESLTADDIRIKNVKTFTKAGKKFSEFLNISLTGIAEENLPILSKNYKKFNKFSEEIKTMEGDLNTVITKLGEHDLEAGNNYTLNLYYLMEINHSLRHIVWDTLYHVDNNHKPLLPVQVEELKDSIHDVLEIYDNFVRRIEGKKFKDFETLHTDCVEKLKKYRKNQVKRIQKNEVGTRNSVLFLAIIAHLRSMINFSKRLQVIETDYSGLIKS